MFFEGTSELLTFPTLKAITNARSSSSTCGTPKTTLILVCTTGIDTDKTLIQHNEGETKDRFFCRSLWLEDGRHLSRVTSITQAHLERLDESAGGHVFVSVVAPDPWRNSTVIHSSAMSA